MSTVDLERLREAASRAFADVGVTVAYAYGSRIAGRPRPDSDLDVAVLVPEGSMRDPLRAERLANRLAEALGDGPDLDVRLLNDMPLALQGRIITEGRRIYEGDAERRVEFETATRRLYFDFLPLIDRDAREGLRAHG